MEYNILIAEDDEDIRGLIKLYLVNEGYNVITAEDGERALEIYQAEDIHLALIDIMMPKLNGYELIKGIREISNTPIIIISAKNLDSDKILGLRIGADDYITKPFNPLEAVARVQSVLRRTYNWNADGRESGGGTLAVGDLILDTENLTLSKLGEVIALTPTEYKILAILMRSPGKIFTKVQIFESIHGEYLESDDNTMMVHMSKLREKIEDDSKNPKYIKTVRGLGYKVEKIEG